MKCYHDMVEGTQICPADSCMFGFKLTGVDCRYSEIHWIPKQIKEVSDRINEMEEKKMVLENRLKELVF